MSRRGRLLLVSPAFHGYWRGIADAFAALGWDVVTHRYDALASAADKARFKLTRELPARLGRPLGPDADADERARIAVHTTRPDRVLVIKGDTLGTRFFDALDRPRIPRALWLYDELRRTRHTDASLARFDTIASYSRHDVAALEALGRPATYVPLGFDASATVTPRHGTEVTFIGARYPRREHLLRALDAHGVPVRAYGRDWSGHLVDRLRTWRVGGHGFATGRDLPLAEAYAVMAGGPATLNVHGDQDGFTMRTFEASGVGAVQLVDRADVAEFYTPGVEVLAFDTDAELVDLAQRAIADDRWGDQLREAARRRTLAEHTLVHRARALEASWA